MEKVKIEIVDGPGGYSLYVNDTRIAGPKPLGGGRLVKAFAVDEQALIDSLPALREIVEKATGTCEWTEEDGIVQTGCGTELWFDDRRMEVKDGQGKDERRD